MFKRYLKDNTCFIVPNSIKRDILLYVSRNNLLIDLSFYTISELKKKLFFDYNDKSVYYLAKEFNLSYDDASLMIENMYYLNDSNINSDKINKLKTMKNYLDKEGLLSYDYAFLNYLNKKNIVTTYGKTNFINEKIFSLLNRVEYFTGNNTKKDIYEFNFIEDEVEFVADKIASLIDKGINVNNIKLVNVNDEYHNVIKKIFSFYNLPLNINEKISLYELEMVKDFITMLKNGKEEALKSFNERYNNTDIYNQIINVLNICYFTDDINYIVRVFQNTFINKNKLKNAIDILKVEDMYEGDNHYFMLGFNSYFPKFHKDEDYLSDKIKIELGFSPSKLINKNIKEYYINKLTSIKNLFISYKKTDYFNTYLVSSLIGDISSNIINNPSIDINTSYSSKFNQLKMAKDLDEFYKFSLKSKNLGVYLNNYDKDMYNCYDNKYTGIKNSDYLKHINKGLTLSYSSLDSFYSCKFKYYLNKLIGEKEDTFFTFIGNVYHQVLSKMHENNFDFEKEYGKAISNRQLTPKEETLLIKLKEELQKDIDILNKQLQNGSFNKFLCEKKLSLDIKNKVSISIVGFIDKILISEDSKYAYVIDYKTGNPSINFDYLEDGIGMQLAIYMYLMHKSKEYADIFLVGCYLQKIVSDDLNKDKITLDGYTYNNHEIIRKIDNSFSLISSISLKKDGELAKEARVFDDAYFENIINTIDNKINEAIESILNADFDINPKIIKGNNVSCTYCKYKDICYRTYKDSVILGGEKDE